MPYLSASAVVIHYEEVLYQVYAPLPLPLHNSDVTRSLGVLNTVWDKKNCNSRPLSRYSLQMV